MKLLSLNFIFFFIYITTILNSATVWSSGLEKIKVIEDNILLNNLDFYDYKGNPTEVINQETDFYIVNFWASWCAPCIKEMKSLDKLSDKLPNLKIITLSQDSDINDAILFFKKNNYENLENYFDFDKNISKEFTLRGLPTTFIFNNKLKAFAKVEGIIDWESQEFIDWLKEN